MAVDKTVQCPKCGKSLELGGTEYRCSDSLCGFFLPRVIRQKVITPALLEELLRTKKNRFH